MSVSADELGIVKRNRRFGGRDQTTVYKDEKLESKSWEYLQFEKYGPGLMFCLFLGRNCTTLDS